jgi:parallel beta-helix repeat protein
LAYCQIKYAAVWDSTRRYPGHDSAGFWINEPNSVWMNGAIVCWNSSPVIRKCNIMLSGYHGIYCVGSGSQPIIKDNNILENDGDGVRCEPKPGDPASLIAVPTLSFNNSFENNARQWADCPNGTGLRILVNANGDSCDADSNISFDPMYEDVWTQNYTLHACSPCITTASDGAAEGAAIGSIPYYIGDTELRGNITVKNITAAANPWRVTCNIFVPAGSTVTIPTGTLFLFQDAYTFKIFGTLLADGVAFKPSDSTNSQAEWSGLIFEEGSAQGSHVINCRFERVSSTTIEAPFQGAITVKDSRPEIKNNVFLNSEYAAISCMQRAAPLIEGNTIIGFGTMGINCYDNSNPTIRHNRISGGIGYGILCEYLSAPLIENNLIYSNMLWGLKCMNGSNPLIQYNTIAYNSYGGIMATRGVGQGATPSNPTILANIVAFNYSYTGDSLGHGINLEVWGSSQPTITYNNFYQQAGSNLVNYHLYTTFPAPNSTNITTDPQFVNGAGDDFLLQADSPAMSAYNGGQIGAYGGSHGNW